MPPLTLEYQSRIIKAKKLATGGLMLLGGAISVISPIAGLAMFADLSRSAAISLSPLMVATVGMMLIALDGLLMIVCSVLILKNHLPSARWAHWLVYFLFLPVTLFFYFLLTDRFATERTWGNIAILAVCCLAVCTGLIAVLVELSIVHKAILRGEYLPQTDKKMPSPHLQG